MGKISRPNKRCGRGAEAARVAARGDRRRRRRVTPGARRSRTAADVAGAACAAADRASLLLLKCVVAAAAAQNDPSTHEGFVGIVKTCHINILLVHTAREQARQPLAILAARRLESQLKRRKVARE